MKANIIKILWGIVLIVLGGFILADKLGYLDLDLLTPDKFGYLDLNLRTRQAYAIIFAGVSLVFFLSYLVDGIRKWGWLFPTLFFAALALVLGLLIDTRADSMIPVSILLSLGIPFYVGFILNPKQWGFLIPGWVMTVITGIVFFSDSANSDLVGALFLFAIATPFLAVYLANRRYKWTLIVGTVLAFVGLLPLIGPILPEDVAGPIVMAIFTLFFIMLYFITGKPWWAIIPAGVFSSIGLVATLDFLLPSNEYFLIGGLQFGVYTGALLLGLAATFGILWLLRGTQPTGWASYPAIGLLILSIMSFLMWKTSSDLIPAITLLIIGITMILMAVLKRRTPNELTSRNI